MGTVLFHWVVPVVHVLSCLFLIVVVLLQTGKGADMGAVFGGGSRSSRRDEPGVWPYVRRSDVSMKTIAVPVVM